MTDGRRAMPPGADEGIFRRPYRVRFDEAAPDGLIRTSVLLRYAQNVAWLHSEHHGFDRAWYARSGTGWLVRAATLEVLAAVPTYAELELTTAVLGWRKVWARRRSEAWLGGVLAASVEIDWVYVDARGAPTRIPPEFGDAFPGLGHDVQLTRVELPAASAPDRRALRVRPHELDPNDHANNAAYLDWFEEAVALASGEVGSEGSPVAPTAALPRRYRLEYAAAAGPAAELWSETWRDAQGWNHRLTLADGREALRGRFEA